MTTTRRLTVDAVLKMATAAAQKHVDASPGDRRANADLSAAIAATWELVKGRLGSSESADLDGLITKLVGRPDKTRPSNQLSSVDRVGGPSAEGR